MSKRRIFEAHGVLFTGESGDQLIGTCPFSNKPDKFYVNQRTWLWDSKTAGLSGNVATFLRLSAERYVGDMTDILMKKLADNRGLPVAAFDGWDIGWDAARKLYTIPVRDIDSNAVDIRLYKLGKRVMSTPEIKTGLLGAHHLPKNVAVPVFICEGEWDAIAAEWMLKKAKAPGLVVAVPGAGVFKQDWVPWLQGRRVFSLYDADEAGEQGEHVLMKKLWTSVQKMMYVHWPTNMPTGFDVRDWVIAHLDQGMVAAFDNLNKLFKPVPKVMPAARKPITGKDDDPDGTLAPAESGESGRASRWEKKPPTFDQVKIVFRKWLHLENTDAIHVMLATVASQAMDGPPVWVFLVGPPGSAKTAVLASLNTYPKIYSTSSLTVHALISGANWKDSADPSLIPRLNGKVMVVKDFTSILAMRDTEKEEIFGILRDAYDGRCGKVFGNGVERNYVSRFTILAAVTPRIYDMSSQHTSLGERFLKFAVGDNLVHEAETEIISRAIGNINQEGEMNDEFQDAVNAFMEHTIQMDKIPSIPKSIEKKIIALAMFGARMRGSVSRDSYRNDIMTSRPSAEIGSRLGIQLAKLSKALAMVAGHDTVGADEYRLLKKVVLDTIPQRNEDIVRTFVKLAQKAGSTVSTAAIAQTTRYPVATVSRLLQDMHVLDIITRKGTVMKFEWQLSTYIRDAMTVAGLYRTEEELERRTRVFVKVVKKKK